MYSKNAGEEGSQQLLRFLRFFFSFYYQPLFCMFDGSSLMDFFLKTFTFIPLMEPTNLCKRDKMGDILYKVAGYCDVTFMPAILTYRLRSGEFFSYSLTCCFLPLSLFVKKHLLRTFYMSDNVVGHGDAAMKNKSPFHIGVFVPDWKMDKCVIISGNSDVRKKNNAGVS